MMWGVQNVGRKELTYYIPVFLSLRYFINRNVVLVLWKLGGIVLSLSLEGQEPMAWNAWCMGVYVCWLIFLSHHFQTSPNSQSCWQYSLMSQSDYHGKVLKVPCRYLTHRCASKSTEHCTIVCRNWTALAVLVRCHLPQASWACITTSTESEGQALEGLSQLRFWNVGEASSWRQRIQKQSDPCRSASEHWIDSPNLYHTCAENVTHSNDGHYWHEMLQGSRRAYDPVTQDLI